MYRGSEACSPGRAYVGLCAYLGPHPQSMPAVESGVRAQARLRFFPCACLTSSPQGYLFWRGQMLPLMRTQGLGLQPELSCFIRDPENK